jgi:hypothetical protein
MYVYVRIFACSLRTDVTILTKLGKHIPWDNKGNTKIETREKSLFLFPVRAVSLIWELSATEERRKGQRCSFWRWDCRNKVQDLVTVSSVKIRHLEVENERNEKWCKDRSWAVLLHSCAILNSNICPGTAALVKMLSLIWGATLGWNYEVNIGTAAWEACDAMWNLCINSVFALGARKTTENPCLWWPVTGFSFPMRTDF